MAHNQHQQGPAWWNQPLPAGWEAKYDQNMKRYFFIDHSTKKTTWEDPRQKMYSQQYQQNASAWQSSLGTSQHGHQHQHQSIAMSDLSPQMTADRKSFTTETSLVTVDEGKVYKLHHMFPSAQKETIRAILQKYRNDEAVAVSQLVAGNHVKKESIPGESIETPDQMEATVVQLKLATDFPSVETGTIKDILMAVDNDEHEARRKLVTLGFQDKSAISPAPTPARSPSPKPAQKAAPSEHEKNRLRDKMKREYASFDEAVLEMALESCGYDETKSRALLSSMDSSPTKSGENKAAAKKKTEQAAAKKKTEPAAAKKKTEPAKPKTTTAAARKKETPKPGPSSTARATTPTPPAPKKVLKPAAQPQLPSPSRSPPSYHSIYLTKPEGPDNSLFTGPDSSLVEGSDKNLLIKEYLPLSGPQKENYKGPESDLRSGPNSALPEGRDKEKVKGPQKDLVQGSMYKYGPAGLLVSNV